MSRWRPVVTAIGILAAGCSPPAPPAASAHRPSLLLVTLDTTRADAVEPESTRVATPALAALAARGVRFTQAYATAPQTLPAHASMLTGLYPAGHGLHDNGRRLATSIPLVAEHLAAAGYATAAFVSGFPLDRQFGLARGFERYDDELGGGLAERDARATTDRALAWLAARDDSPFFLWVHYYDPHEPYAPPEPFRSRYREAPYLGEIAAMDEQLARLLGAFEAHAQERRIVVAGDHGEALGEHGETYHGNLLYQGVMRVPLVVAGTGISPTVRDVPASTRRVHDTLLDWAGIEAPLSLLRSDTQPVLGEAMKPYLQYGWQPQVMAIEGAIKVIRSGHTEVYDVRADPSEERDLATAAELGRDLRQALRDYPVPSTAPVADAAEALDAEARRKLASLGYVASGAPPTLRVDAPDPSAMTGLFHALDVGSGLFVRERYAEAIPVFERVLEADPNNFTVALRLAVAHSLTGRPERALRYFARAREIEPESIDLEHYLAMHHFRRGEWQQAEPLFERVLLRTPERLPALESLARIRERQGRLDEAAGLLERAAALQASPEATLAVLGALDMRRGDTAGAILAFERLREVEGAAFEHELELGVLYLDARRLVEARDALDRVSPSHSAYALALFKRAQVSVLLGEPDRAARVEAAWRGADERTRELIRREKLFTGIPLP